MPAVETIVLLVLAIPLLGAPVLALVCAQFSFLRDNPATRSAGSLSRPALLAIPLVGLVFYGVLLLLQEYLLQGSPLLIKFQWAAPVLQDQGGINFDLRIDGLALFYALVVSGMGLLISVYASLHYFGHTV